MIMKLRELRKPWIVFNFMTSVITTIHVYRVILCLHVHAITVWGSNIAKLRTPILYILGKIALNFLWKDIRSWIKKKPNIFQILKGGGDGSELLNGYPARTHKAPFSQSHFSLITCCESCIVLLRATKDMLFQIFVVLR